MEMKSWNKLRWIAFVGWNKSITLGEMENNELMMISKEKK